MDFIGYGLAGLLFFVGLWIGKRTERNAIEREQQTHEDQTKEIVQKAKEELVPLFGREVRKVLEVAGLSKEQIDSPIVQDAIQASASSIIDTWEGLAAGGSVILYPPTPGGTYTAGTIPGITEETEEQKEEDGEKDKSEEEEGLK